MEAQLAITFQQVDPTFQLSASLHPVVAVLFKLRDLLEDRFIWHFLNLRSLAQGRFRTMRSWCASCRR